MTDDLITPTTPLRLKEALAIAFPLGGLTVSGLRREIARGRLSVEVIAGKQFVTLAGIEEMRRLCRVQVQPPPSETTDRGITAQAALAEKLRRMKK